MGFLVLLKFAVHCFDILAWPLFALGYPLCASIRAIESNSNSDIRKLVTYWVLFSLILLFDHVFARLLEWLSFWPYVKLMAIFLLVAPHFDGSFYVYENLVRPCFSVNPSVVFKLCNKWKEEYFLVAAERFVKENGHEALERLIASKCTKPNVDVEEIKAVAAAEKIEVDSVKCKEPNVAQKETKAVEVIEKKEVAAELKCKEPNVAQKETKGVEVTAKKEVAAAKWVNRTEPNLAQTENRTFAASGTKETATTAAATAGSESKLPEIHDSKKVQIEIPAWQKFQKEWTCALCQVTTHSETILNSHLQGKKHRAELEELEAKNQAAKNKCVSGNGSNLKNTGKQEEKVDVNPNKTGVAIKQCVFWCNICNIRCPGGIDMASHLNGRRHRDRIQELTNKTGVAIKWSELCCNICNIRCTGGLDIASHLNGRRHWDRIQELTGFARGGFV